jgi:hypothetical protein
MKSLFIFILERELFVYILGVFNMGNSGVSKKEGKR